MSEQSGRVAKGVGAQNPPAAYASGTASECEMVNHPSSDRPNNTYNNNNSFASTCATSAGSNCDSTGEVHFSDDNKVGAGAVQSVDAVAMLENRPPSVRRKFRTLTFGRRCKTKVSGKEKAKKRGNKGSLWNFKFNYRLKNAGASTSTSDVPEPGMSCDACVCTGYRRTEEHHLGAGVVFQASKGEVQTVTPARSPGTASLWNLPGQDGSGLALDSLVPMIDLLRFNPEDYPIDDWEERARAERARELEEGVDPPPGFRPVSPCMLHVGDLRLTDLAAAFQNRLSVGARYVPSRHGRHSDPALSTETHLISQFAHVTSQGACIQRTVHTQVDYVHCLVPDLREITDCGFYWGKMDRYEAEKLLESKPEGTFLLRDSAQEEYLFSVSFRRYGRSLHARIEQWNHRFSFDSHDPGVFASETVCGLIEHYKDPSCCMFFEPMLTIPLHRTFTFPLQHLCRSAICKATSYDGVNQLQLPKSLKSYLKEYHYKQRVRVRRFEVEH